MIRVVPVLLLTLIVCTACSDPEHGAYKVNRFFGLWALVAAAVVAVLFEVLWLRRLVSR